MRPGRNQGHLTEQVRARILAGSSPAALAKHETGGLWIGAPHLQEVDRAILEAVYGTGPRQLIVTMPPRHSKSTYCTQLFPAWFMLRSPSRYIMSSSFNTELAKGCGRGVRESFANPQAQSAFPDSRLAKHTRSATEWATDAGGKYFGVGLNGTTTGRPANLLIVDDPIKSREGAESMTQRNQTWDFYVSGLSTRLQPEEDGTPPRQIVVLTRWHPDDVALNAMPVAHVGGSNWGLSALVGGATVVILREFDPAAMVRAITAETVTKMFLVPAALRTCRA